MTTDERLTRIERKIGQLYSYLEWVHGKRVRDPSKYCPDCGHRKDYCICKKKP